MRIAILHTRLSPYFASCFKLLREQGHELVLHVYPSDTNAPFDPEEFGDMGPIYNGRASSEDEIHQKLTEFNPEAILVSGWIDRSYLRICKRFKKDGVPVVAGCDTQWSGSLRQRIACLISKLYLKPAIDILWVPGKPQQILAERLGYRGDACWTGLYACDWKRFASSRNAGEKATYQPRHLYESPYFLFVGRYLEIKGIPTLLEAYSRYCEQVDSPWNLVCAGTGPLDSRINCSNATNAGFIQPSDLPKIMVEANCFILPSQYEPWGVVLQEAAASGLPLICSKAWGSGHHLIEQEVNGLRFTPGNIQELTDSMVWIHKTPTHALARMADRSFELSKQYTPEIWAQTLIKGIGRLSK